MSYLQLGTLVLGDLGVPYPSAVNRSRTRMVRVQPGYDGEEAVWDFSDAGGFLHVFQSANNVGHLTAAEKVQLETLEASKTPFTLTTDLLGEDGVNEVYTAYFDPESKPQYTPAVPDRSYWVYQLPLYLIPQGG